MNSPAGKYCHECVEGKGCKIYKVASQDCLDYKCLFNQMEKVSTNLRPDKCHVIFEKVGDNIITGLIDNGHDMTQDAKNQISSFINEGFSIFIKTFGKWNPTIIPAKNKNSKDIYNEVLKIK